jgi:hypothetical protein
MSETEAVELLNSLLELDCSQAKDWLSRVWQEEDQVPNGFNWLGLAEAAAFKARKEINPKLKTPNLVCAEVATTIYDFLANREINSATKESFWQSSMMLRAYMIRRFGVVSHDPVLDVEKITSWFLDGLDQYQDVQAQISEWREAFTAYQQSVDQVQNLENFPLEKLQQLRRIKTRLGVLKFLYEDVRIKPTEEISKWLAIRKHLP